jgi:pyruvate formate lyase activating enzyme
MKALVFDIQRYSIHDGGGIRTLIFFKGCPLYCPWCSNPESQSNEIEKVKIKSKCMKCEKCYHSVKECPTGAIKEFGRYMSLDELKEEILKDRIFYDSSGGGVTLSGGEVLMQADFAIELLKMIKKYGIDTAIETSGQGSSQKLMEMSKYLDTALYDLKIMDEKKAKEIIGADSKLIKKNFKLLLESDVNVIPRVPLIPNYTTDQENLDQIIAFVKENNLSEIHLLPYHEYGVDKYNYLNRDYEPQNIEPSSDEELNKIKVSMESEGLDVNIGGL